MSDQEHRRGVALSINKVDKTTYEIKQVTPPKMMQLDSSGHKKKIEDGFGPISLAGHVDVETFEIGVEVAVLGINLGQMSGNVKDGIKFKVDLVAVTGEVDLYLKKGNELWTSFDLKTPFSDSMKDESKVLDL